MASGIRVLGIASKNYSRRIAHNFFLFRNHSSNSSNPNSLLHKLLNLPNSHIKTTLDHQFPSLPTSLLSSFDFLITSLSPSSIKPNLVITLSFTSFMFHINTIILCGLCYIFQFLTFFLT